MNVVRMSFNGVDLSEWLTVHHIRRDIGNARQVQTDDAPRLGVNLQDVRIASKVIEVSFSIWARDRNSVKHRLAGIFNVDKAVRLTFSDEPDKYYMAIPINEIQMQEESGYRSSGTVTFLIPDGVAHSTTSKYFDSHTAVESEEKLVFNLVNNGTAPAFPVIKVKSNADNGYVGIVNASGIFELGNKEKVAGYTTVTTTKPSEVLLNFKDSSILTAYSRAVKNQAVSYDNAINWRGGLNTKSVWGRHHIYLSQRGGLTGANAGSMSWDLPVDSSGGRGSLHDYLWWRQVFQLETSYRYGFMSVWVTDTAGQFLYGVETIKRGHGIEAEYRLSVADGRGGRTLLRSWEFVAGPSSEDNPFNQTGGFTDIKRNDDRLQVHWWGSYPVFTVPALKEKQSAKVHVCLGSFDHVPLLDHLYLDELSFRKDFVPVTHQIPNRFSVGSDIVIDHEEDLVLIDGIPKMAEIVDGSQWLSIPPGTSQLECFFSSSVRKKPTVTITFEERYL